VGKDFRAAVQPLQGWLDYCLPSLVVGRVEAVKGFNGRDALPRVRNRKTKPDAEDRVPSRFNRYDRENCFTPS
jgi:hypothetical protein